MKIIRAKVLGYCMGVRRAVDIAVRSLSDYSGKSVCTFGPLIHNKTALKSLESRGMGMLSESDIDSIDVMQPPVVVVRAHGVPPDVQKKLLAKNCLVVDATCPRVLSSQKRTAEYAAKGYAVIIAGDKNHGEVTSIAGYALEKGSPCLVVENPHDVSNIDFTSPNFFSSKFVLIAQTTISRQEYEAIASELRKAIPELLVVNSICPATQERQDALSELCSQVEGLLVIGGKNSANTQRLYHSAQDWMQNKPVAHIESPDEIPQQFFSLGIVGLTAGASTPDEVIDQVEERLISSGD